VVGKSRRVFLQSEFNPPFFPLVPLFLLRLLQAPAKRLPGFTAPCICIQRWKGKEQEWLG